MDRCGAELLYGTRGTFSLLLSAISRMCEILGQNWNPKTVLWRSLFKKKFRFEISEIPRAQWMVHSSCTDPTQATARLVLVLVSRIQESGSGNNNFVKWKGTFRSEEPTDRNDQTGQSASPSKLVPNISVGPNRNGPFHLMYQR